MSQTAKVFKNGQSQAIRLPKAYRFNSKEVFIRKEGENVIISPKPDSWEDFFASDRRPTPDFMENRNQLEMEEREMFE
ncbi:MAG: antitoxin [bacterium]|nr:antitoxin [bacterium]